MNTSNRIYICFFVIVVAVVVLVIFFILIHKYLNFIDFKEIVKLERLPKGLKIKKRRRQISANYYELNYPHWLYENKDQTEDKRRRNNFIIWEKSYLYIENFIANLRDPAAMIELVNNIRSNIIMINKCREEIIKEKNVRAKKERQVRTDSIQAIINEFIEAPIEFEDYVSELYKKLGYDAKLTPPTNDGGYDIEITKNGLRFIIECKCFAQKNKIGRPLIQKLVGANQKVKAYGMIFITTSSFSKGALEFAKETNVKVIDGEKLLQLKKQVFPISNNSVLVINPEWMLTLHDLKIHIAKDIWDLFY